MRSGFLCHPTSAHVHLCPSTQATDQTECRKRGRGQNRVRRWSSCRRHVPWKQSPQGQAHGSPKADPAHIPVQHWEACKALECSASAWPHQHHPQASNTFSRSPHAASHILRTRPSACNLRDKLEAARSGAWLAALAPLPSVHPTAFSPSTQSPSESRILGDYLSPCSLQNTIDCAAYKPHICFSWFWRLKPEQRVQTCSGSGEGLLQAGGQWASRLSSSGSSKTELSRPLS